MRRAGEVGEDKEKSELTGDTRQSSSVDVILQLVSATRPAL